LPKGENFFQWLENTEDFLRGKKGRRIPRSIGDDWICPVSWFDRLVKDILERYGETYVIQKIKGERCAPSCRDSKRADCECTCLGKNHGSGQPEGRWYDEVGEARVIQVGEERFSIRLLSKKKD
jgi:hypothetical protein